MRLSMELHGRDGSNTLAPRTVAQGTVKSHHLKTFLAVASDGSFSRAARRVHVSQSTASLHIKELEEAVGTRLLDRAVDGVRPTAAGRVMITYAERLLGLEQEALSEVRAHAAPPQVVLRIAASTVPAECHLPRILAAFRQMDPVIEVSVQVMSSERSLAELRTGACDLAFVSRCEPSPDLKMAVFDYDETVLVGASELPDPVPATLRLVAREPEAGADPTIGGVLPEGLRPMLVVSTAEGVRRCVLHGAGHAFLSRLAVDDELQAGVLRQVPWPGTPARRPLYVVQSTRTPPSVAAAALTSLVLTSPPRRATM